MKLLLLFLSLAVLAYCSIFDKFNTPPVPDHTEVTFEANFTCAIGRTYCLTGYYEEEDSWSTNEYVYRFPVFCTTNGSLYHHRLVYYSGQDGFIDGFYEPVVELMHNCTTNGRVRQIFHRFQKISYFHNTSFASYNLDLLDNGQPHPYHEDYADLSVKWEPRTFDWLYNRRPLVNYKDPEDIPFSYNATDTDEDLINFL